MRKKPNGFTAVEALLIILVLAIVGFGGYYVWQNQQNKAKSTVVQTTTTSSTSTTKAQEGTITGTASYPSSGLPADEEVCAVNVADSTKVYCDKIGLRQPVNTCGTDLTCKPSAAVTDFSIKALVGDYYVYATAEKELPSYKAYYNEFAKCGNSTSCPMQGHTQYIKVTVTANSTVKDVNPGDWYNR